MRKIIIPIVFVAVIATVFIATRFGKDKPEPKMTAEEFQAEIAAISGEGSDKVAPSLARQSQLFNKPKIYKVTDSIYTAVGYGLPNSIMIIGDDGVIIIDAMETTQEARRVQKDFRKITDKPIKALIYTHNHADHTFGSRGWDLAPDAEIIGHKTTTDKVTNIAAVVGPIISYRSTRMFGTMLQLGEEGLVNDGIGPFLGVNPNLDYTVGYLPPTIEVDEHLSIEIAGVQMEIYHTPGETDDQINVWVPDQRAWFAGDNIYQTFPNLYTIRGTSYRDVRKWADSVDRIVQAKPEHLVLSHTPPISGEENIRDIATAYRDAIKYTHDQTVRCMNRGVILEEIGECVELPEHLKYHPWLLEHYGRVEFTAKSIFVGYLGWFGGDGAFLDPVPLREKAELMAEMAGGAAQLLQKADAAYDEGKYRWAAELTTYVILLDGPELAEAKQLKADSFRQMAYATENPPSRNTWLTQALELEGEIDLYSHDVTANGADLMKYIPMDKLLSALPVRLDAEKALGQYDRLGFRFKDTGEEFTLEISNGVAYLRDGIMDDPTVVIETTTTDWLDLLLQRRGFLAMRTSGDIAVPQGSTTDLIRILGYFTG